MDKIQWGNVGEWIGGLGAFVAAAVAIWIAERGHRQATKNLERQLEADQQRALASAAGEALIDHAKAASIAMHACRLLLNERRMPTDDRAGPVSLRRGVEAFDSINSASFDCERSRRQLSHLPLEGMGAPADAVQELLAKVASPALAEPPVQQWINAWVGTTVAGVRPLLVDLVDEMDRRETAALRCLEALDKQHAEPARSRS